MVSLIRIKYYPHYSLEEGDGLIVDYVGVFRNLQKALVIYGTGSGGGIQEGDTPVKDKQALTEELKTSLTKLVTFCKELGFAPETIWLADGLQKVKLFGDAVDAIVANEESKKKFLIMAYNVTRLYKAILPDPLVGELKPQCVLFEVLARKINSPNMEADISEVLSEVENLLDHSIAAQSYVIREPKDKEHVLTDLSAIDFEKMKEEFEKGHKHLEAERLKNNISNKLQKMVQLNQTRLNFYQKFQEMIEEYNNSSLNIDEFFRRLIDFTKSLGQEEKRTIAEHLSEEELAVFDLLTRPEMKLSNKETQQVKKVARELLDTLKREKLVIDWRKKQQAKAGVQVAIKNIFEALPQCYTEEIYNRKVQLVYQHIYESYYGSGQSVYANAG